MASNAQQIAAFVAAFGGGAVLVETVKSLFQRGKMDADAAKTITDAATQLLAPLQARVEELEEDVTTLREKLSGAQDDLAEARAQLRDTLRQLQSATWELEQLRRRVQRSNDALDARDERGDGTTRRPSGS